MAITSEAIITIDQIIDSLHRRGFYTGPSVDAMQTQVDTVIEELGEVARGLRRYRQGVAGMRDAMLGNEAADVVIAAVCLGAATCGSQLSAVIAAKLEEDERRGYLHNG